MELLLNEESFIPSIQSGFESEANVFAPDVVPMTINWTGSVNSDDTLSVIVRSSNGIAHLVARLFPTLVGSQFTVLIF